MFGTQKIKQSIAVPRRLTIALLALGFAAALLFLALSGAGTISPKPPSDETLTVQYQCQQYNWWAKRTSLRVPPPEQQPQPTPQTHKDALGKSITPIKPAWVRVDVRGTDTHVPPAPVVNASVARAPLGAFVPRDALLQTTGLQCLVLQDHQSLAEQFHGFWDGPMGQSLPPLYLSAISTVFRQHPDSTFLVHSNTLPLDQFDSLRAMGFNIAVVRFDAERALTYGKLPGLRWLREDRVRHAEHRNIRTHTSDLMRTIFMYQCGGIYLDLDSVLLRPLHFLNRAITMEPMRPDHLRVQYIKMSAPTSMLSCNEGVVVRPEPVGQDGSMTLSPYILHGDFALVPGVLAFGPRDNFIYMMMQVFDEAYDPSCFSCVGPMAANKAYMASTPAEKIRLQLYPADVMFGPNWSGVLDKNEEFWVTTTEERARILINDAAARGFTQHLYGSGQGAPKFDRNSYIHRLLLTFQLLPLPDVWSPEQPQQQQPPAVLSSEVVDPNELDS